MGFCVLVKMLRMAQCGVSSVVINHHPQPRHHHHQTMNLDLPLNSLMERHLRQESSLGQNLVGFRVLVARTQMYVQRLYARILSVILWFITIVASTLIGGRADVIFIAVDSALMIMRFDVLVQVLMLMWCLS